MCTDGRISEGKEGKSREGKGKEREREEERKDRKEGVATDCQKKKKRSSSPQQLTHRGLNEYAVYQSQLWADYTLFKSGPLSLVQVRETTCKLARSQTGTGQGGM